MDLRSWNTAPEGFARYLLTTGKSEQTVRTYVSALSLFWRWCEEREECPVDTDRNLVRAWLIERSRKVSSTRVHSNLAGLRLYYDHLIEEGLRADNPAKDLRWKRTQTLPTEPLEQADLRAIYKACEYERDRLIILLLVYSGVRITEFASMTAEDIDWRHGRIAIKHGKGDVARHVSPAPEVMDRLHIFMGLMPEGPIWRSIHSNKPMKGHQIRKRIYFIADRAGIGHVHPHRFRSTFACEFLDQFDGDIHALKGAMGHKAITTTAQYAKSAELRRGLAKMQRFSLPDIAS